jgi:hypothetical protein
MSLRLIRLEAARTLSGERKVCEALLRSTVELPVFMLPSASIAITRSRVVVVGDRTIQPSSETLACIGWGRGNREMIRCRGLAAGAA